MLIREKIKSISKYFIAASIILLCANFNSAFANTISGIEVNQKDNSEYKVMLKLDKFSNVKTLSDGKDNLTLIVSSALPSESIDILYDNASDIKNVIVQKKNSENTLISLQGKNIQNAKIYTKELSTGATKQLNSNILGNMFVITDKKVFAFAVLAIFMLFAPIFMPKKKRIYSEKELVQKSIRKYNKKQTINSIKRKNKQNSRTLPSINYGINGSFSAANANMSTPKDFVINEYQEQKRRKVG
ncbi:hypothetical protein II906_03455 [bacterium]|nr:hypothetical protein [bacterium]